MFLPEIKRISLYELLAEANEILPIRVFSEAAVFDPCAARDDSGMQFGVRKLAGKAGVEFEPETHERRQIGWIN